MKMKELIITFLIAVIVSTVSFFLSKNVINKRENYHNEIIEKVETSKNEIIDEVKSNGEKLDKLLEIASKKSAFENDK